MPECKSINFLLQSAATFWGPRNIFEPTKRTSLPSKCERDQRGASDLNCWPLLVLVFSIPETLSSRTGTDRNFFGLTRKKQNPNRKWDFFSRLLPKWPTPIFWSEEKKWLNHSPFLVLDGRGGSRSRAADWVFWDLGSIPANGRTFNSFLPRLKMTLNFWQCISNFPNDPHKIYWS